MKTNRALFSIPILMTAISSMASSHYTICAEEGKTCNIDGGRPVILRYGANPVSEDQSDNNSGGYIHTPLSGIKEIWCGNDLGDPAWGIAKKCDTIDNIPSIAGIESHVWGYQCADQDESCQIHNADVPTWVHYYAFDSDGNLKAIAGIQDNTFPCTNENFKYDPLPGAKKKCNIGEPVIKNNDGYPVKPDWIECAAEDQFCQLRMPDGSDWIDAAANTPVLMRFSFWGRSVYQLGSFKKGFLCSHSTFGNDSTPYSTNGYCSYVLLPNKYRGNVQTASSDSIIGHDVPQPKILGGLQYGRTFAAWQKVAEFKCAKGAQCDLSYSLAYGTSSKNYFTKTTEWAEWVTNSVGLGVVGIKASVEASANYGDSENFQNALNVAYGQKTTVNCVENKSPYAYRLVLYQFETQTDIACILSGDCSTVTQTMDTFCAVNPPDGYQGPQCLPDDCADEFCYTCKNSI